MIAVSSDLFLLFDLIRFVSLKKGWSCQFDAKWMDFEATSRHIMMSLVVRKFAFRAKLWANTYYYCYVFDLLDCLEDAS